MIGAGADAVGVLLTAAGLAEDDVQRWIAASAVFRGEGATPPQRFAFGSEAAVRYWALGDELLCRLPSKPQRNAQEAAAAEAIKEAARF